MGLITTLFGYINEAPSLDKSNRTHNEQMINLLIDKKDIEWPPLSKEMFHIIKSNPSGPNLSYFGRIITIGASLKGVEYEWEEWLDKFENLLQNTYWYEAQIILETEWYGQLKYEWKIKTNIDVNTMIPKKDDWSFTGYKRKIIE